MPISYGYGQKILPYGLTQTGTHIHNSDAINPS